MWSPAKITWISLLKDWEKTSSGIYPVILLNKQTREFVVAYWISETNEPNSSWPELDKKTIWEWLDWDKYRESLIEQVYTINTDNIEAHLSEIEDSLNTVIEVYKKISTPTDKETHYRMYSPWRQWENREQYVAEGVMGIGWDQLGDISKYPTREEIKDKYIQEYWSEENNNILACYQFAHEMKKGDIVIAKQWRDTLLWYGIVQSDYIFDDSRENHKSIRKVLWHKKGKIVHDRHKTVLKTLTDVTRYKDYVIYLKNLLGILDTSSSNPMRTWTSTHELNTILYGVPGTGKTYHTINYAVAIIEWKSLDEINKEDRSSLRQRFEEYKKLGQIVFCSFHQSLSYEEFIEWIRANTDESGNVSYEIEDGIFKDLANKSQKKPESKNFDAVYEQFINDLIEAWNQKELITLKQGKPFYVRINSKWNCSVSPQTETATEMIVTKKMIKDYIENNENQQEYWKTYTTAIVEYIKNNYTRDSEQEDNTNKNYVLIIDEINRGNMSKIFGELITLLEPSKRLWAEEELTLQLPYSKEQFGVPNNLYVIGTMNTTDRSIALIDIALRRRFKFKEMQPDSSLLDFYVENISIKQVFETINKRIEFLYDRDHLIGHSFFMKLKNGWTLNHLNEIFAKDILPLLQEYFYEDREKIQIILWDHKDQWNKTNGDKIIQEINQSVQSVVGFNHEDLEDKKRYEINPTPTAQSYIWIYTKINNESQSE